MIRLDDLVKEWTDFGGGIVSSGSLEPPPVLFALGDRVTISKEAQSQWSNLIHFRGKRGTVTRVYWGGILRVRPDGEKHSCTVDGSYVKKLSK